MFVWFLVLFGWFWFVWLFTTFYVPRLHGFPARWFVRLFVYVLVLVQVRSFVCVPAWVTPVLPVCCSDSSSGCWFGSARVLVPVLPFVDVVGMGFLVCLVVR